MLLNKGYCFKSRKIERGFMWPIPFSWDIRLWWWGWVFNGYPLEMIVWQVFISVFDIKAYKVMTVFCDGTTCLIKQDDHFLILNISCFQYIIHYHWENLILNCVAAMFSYCTFLFCIDSGSRLFPPWFNHMNVLIG